MSTHPVQMLDPVFDYLDGLIQDNGDIQFMLFTYAATPFLAWVLSGGLRRKLWKGKSYGGHSQGSSESSGSSGPTATSLTGRRWSQMAHYQFESSGPRNGQKMGMKRKDRRLSPNIAGQIASSLGRRESFDGVA